MMVSVHHDEVSDHSDLTSISAALRSRLQEYPRVCKAAVCTAVLPLLVTPPQGLHLISL